MVNKQWKTNYITFTQDFGFVELTEAELDEGLVNFQTNCLNATLFKIE